MTHLTTRIAVALAASLLWGASAAVAQNAVVTGELKTWHRITLTFDGPNTNETADPNPFIDYAVEVTFTKGGTRYVVPGFYAADGDAAETSATAGDKWRVHFAPDDAGTWNWTASFRQGDDVAVDGGGASAGFFDGATGSFNVSRSDKTGRDHRGKGRLEYVGEHYLRFAQTGEWFVKAGADAPENTLAYEDFDDVPDRGGRRKDWQPHQQDYNPNEAAAYTWQGGKGTELLGVVSYLSSKGVNAFSFLTFNTQGDDRNVFPHRLKVPASQYGGNDEWSNDLHHDRFDVSRLAQWERIFSYADLKGMFLHFKLQETENDGLMDGGAVGRERKVYFRELIARFGHHLALNWNMGEENTQTAAQRRAMADYFADTDPYNHLRVIHTYPGDKESVYSNLLGGGSEYTGASLQTNSNNGSQNFDDALEWTTRSAGTGEKWVVSVDEPGNAGTGVDSDPRAIDQTRQNVVWATFMAGGAGTEFYYGYQSGCGDLECQDHRSRDQKYTEAAIALDFFQTYFQGYLPQVENDNDLTADGGDYVLAKPGRAYAVYRPDGGSTAIGLPAGSWRVRWYNPRTGQMGASQNLTGGTLTAPDGQDWVGLLEGGDCTEGQPCDDGDPDTGGDLIRGDCTCRGTPVGEQDKYWLEADCASYGSAWQPTPDPNADGGQALTATGGEPIPNDPPSDEAYQVTFDVEVASAGTYRLAARTLTTKDTDDSAWIRVDDGTWIKWNKIGVPYTGGYQWAHARQWNGGDQFTDVSFPLEVGAHTITVAYREPGLRLDKLLLTTEAELPSGLGGAAGNCAPAPNDTPSDLDDEAALALARVTLFPNPTSDGLTIRSEGVLSELEVRNSLGALVLRGGDHPGGAWTLTLGALPPGLYLVRGLVDGRGWTATVVVD